MLSANVEHGKIKKIGSYKGVFMWFLVTFSFIFYTKNRSIYTEEAFGFVVRFRELEVKLGFDKRFRSHTRMNHVHVNGTSP